MRVQILDIDLTIISVRFVYGPMSNDSNYSSGAVTGDVMSIVVKNIFNSFQDYLSNEQDVREVRIHIFLRDRLSLLRLLASLRFTICRISNFAEKL
jgi:hypothetical protein